MCAAQPADQSGFSTIPAGMPFAVRRALSSLRGPTLPNTAAVLRACSRAAILTSLHRANRSGTARAIRFRSELDVRAHHHGPFVGQVEDLDRVGRVARD